MNGTRPRRVLHITEDLGLGGLERVVTTLCLGVDRARFAPEVLCLRDGGPLADELTAAGVPVLRLPRMPGRTDYLAFLKIARLLRERGIDVLHTHNTPALLDGGAAALLARTPTVVHTEHGRQFPDKLRYVVSEHLLSHTIHRVVGVSEQTTANLRRYVRIPRRRLRTIPNGIDESVYSSDRADRERIRRELGIDPEQPVIAAVARLSPEKDLATLFKAVASVRIEHRRVVLLLVGVGELEAELRSAAGALELNDVVRFLGARRDVTAILQAADVFAISSVSEGLPMALLEAMASGTAIVATRVGGIPATIRHGIDGALVEPRNPAQLAKELGELLRDIEKRHAFGTAARSAFGSQYGARAMVAAYERLYLRDD